MQKQLKLVFSVILIMTLCFGSINIIHAADETECIDGSYLTEEEYSEGYSENRTRGIYLGSGTSTISKVGTGKIAAGGRTVGQTTVAKITIAVRVERLVNGSWETYTSWSATKYNSALVSTSKTLTVPVGYYYRVYSTHAANSDSSGSFTNGIHI